MKGVEGFKARLGANIQESMGGAAGGAGGPLPEPAHGVPSRYDGVTRPRDALTIPVAKLRPDPDQPRKEFDPEDLAMLGESLKARGQLQPIRVRWAGEGGWVIVSGERRWRAAQIAGLEALAAVEAKGEPRPEDVLEDQLVENCVREDLKPVEQAHAFRALMDRRGYSGRQLAEVLHVSHAHVQRALALLVLPEDVQSQVERGALAPSAAAEIAKIAEPEVQSRVAQAAVTEGLRRDEVAELVQAVKAKRSAPPARPEPVTLDVGGVVVTLKWKKGGEVVTATQALRKALKQLHDRERDDQAA
jgi:ParB family chromosome partitioning protein